MSVVLYNKKLPTPIRLHVDSGLVNWDRINLFRERHKILKRNWEDLGINTISGNFQKNGNFYSGSIELPNEFRLKGLYVDFRPFYSNKEPTNFEKICNYITTLTDSSDYQIFVKDQKRNFKSRFVENGWFNINGEKLSSKTLIKIWFNAKVFHSDKNKIEELRKYLHLLSSDSFSSLVFLCVYDSIKAINWIVWSISELTPTNLIIKLPNRIVKEE